MSSCFASNAFWSANWNAPEEAEGPKAKQLVTCPDQPEPGVLVELYGDIDPSVDACSASITITDGEYQEMLTPQIPDPNLATSCWFAGANGRAGNYVVHASLRGYSSTVRQFTVWPSRCGVRTSTVHVHTVPETEDLCGEPTTPSVVARLDIPTNNPSDSTCGLVTVEAEQDGMIYQLTQMDSFQTDEAVICHFFGPVEIAGELTVTAKSPGYQTNMEKIFVPEEFCHVQTQHVNISLQPTPSCHLKGEPPQVVRP